MSFDDEINDSLITEKIVVNNGHTYNYFKEEIETGKEHVEEVSIETRIELLTNSTIPPIITEDLKSILEFGNELAFHTQFIHTELPKIAILVLLVRQLLQ